MSPRHALQCGKDNRSGNIGLALGDGDSEEEIGDLLFASVNVARHLKIDSEAAAEKTCNKFVSRFAEMERQATAAGKKLADLSLSELDALWDSAKHEEHA